MNIENVVTVGLRLGTTTEKKFSSLMEELRRLVETAGGAVVQNFVQRRERPDSGTLIGLGKAEEIAAEVKRLGVKTVIFDDDLSPGQQKNIEKIIPAKIVDRTRLILDIFAQRARTKEGQLQIELAQLNYLVPRLTGSWRGYSQQSGGIGTRGPGEKKIEVERRYVRERIKRLKKEIEDMERHRAQSRVSRAEVPLPQVALVGYTNVGKSTWLNSLVGNENAVYADDKLFATLDPTTRRVKLPSGQVVLFTDTVGFIQKLPNALMQAFRATLEEVTQAALLVHLIDATADNRNDQQQTVLDVIKELKANHIPMITVANKVDLISPDEKMDLKRKGIIAVSAKTREGLSEMLKAIESKLNENLVDVTFDLPHNKHYLVGEIYRAGAVLSEESSETGVRVMARMDPGNRKRIEHQLNAVVK